jgi:hypothetical protein
VQHAGHEPLDRCRERAVPGPELYRKGPEFTFMNLGGRRSVERRAPAQELVEDEAELIDDAGLRRGKPRKLFGRRVTGITPGRLRRRELIGEAKSSEDRNVGAT